MKLRIRSLESKQTIRVEIAGDSSLLDLKTLISSKLSSSSPSPIPPKSISLSLNRRDELVADHPSDSLRSVGLTSGDLIFYTQTLTPTKPTSETLTLASDPDHDMEVEAENKSEILTLDNPSSGQTLTPEIPNSDETLALVPDPGQEMEVAMEPVETSSSEKSPSPSFPCFLKRVMELEKEEIKGNLGFLVVAVHAVFLESGFLVCSGEDGSCLPKDWNSGTALLSVQYTVPALLGHIQERGFKVATLKFSVMKYHVSVYGYLNREPDVYRLHLDLSKVMALLVFLGDRVSREEEKEVFQFWKTVKDGLCLPLLIDICQKNGLPLPPCFARLPTELIFRVLELLPGVDIARFGCTGSEMRYLTSNESLWKMKFMQEFGQGKESEIASLSSWKAKFKRCWVNKRDGGKAGRALMDYIHFPRISMPRYPPFAPQGFPVVGGDYDRFPAIGGLGPIGSGLGYPRNPVRRHFSPNCNLGGNFMG
ncbi:uncharacterized protein A4U43_C04F25290 [Asparagus officinalis]|uniref:F-box domain-containing protein n=1 Tax=Asparagus officinalis TaxID=4686 RepID=A0A5P1F450_ASPOF|nr:F-box protein SKIP22-like [Asparagus officinalis]XP_020261854.1 F-box protein SKIP22-like [Asparagus officinalis]ONK72952.1 uncharacterized protein A4U43_C04F25290 [Asparagus officinalis]